MKQIALTISILIIFWFSGNTQPISQWNVGVGGNPARNCLANINGPQQSDILWEGGLYAKRGYQTFIEGDIVVASRRHNYNDILHGAKIVAHDLHTGDTLWTMELPVINGDVEQFSQVKGINGSQVYASRSGGPGNQSVLYALDAADGSIIWQNNSEITQTFSEDVSFAPNGDIIVGNFESVIRIDKNTGATIWSTTRSSPTTDGSAVVVSNNRVYGWEATANGPRISAFDLETGDFLYGSDAIAPGWVQQTGLMAGPDGHIYAPRVQNNPDTDYFVSLTDNGAEIKPNWSVEYGYALWASYGVGPDGSVYTYDRFRHVIRLDPANGEVLNTSIEFCSEYPAGPKMAIGSDGVIYLTNGKYGESKLFSFNPDLSLRWSEDYGTTVIEGPSIAYDGTMIVCAGNYLFKAYAAENPAQLIADFLVDSLDGIAPLTAQFQDASVGINAEITNWEWDFENDGVIDSYEQNPEFTYELPGSYSVYLKVSNANLEDIIIKTNFVQVFSTTGINKENQFKILAYPNPAKQKMYVKWISANVDPEETRLVDLSGRMQSIMVSRVLDNQISIDVSHLKPGFYILEIYSKENLQFRQKVLIQNN
ncbi:MAG: PQQ-binding-like beta-propeller repeat protein [Chlorobi bacterium]|nr:PQQ-binding-like beta-propeller repeat protein [Chlorobiota bacterium]